MFNFLNTEWDLCGHEPTHMHTCTHNRPLPFGPRNPVRFPANSKVRSWLEHFNSPCHVSFPTQSYYSHSFPLLLLKRRKKKSNILFCLLANEDGSVVCFLLIRGCVFLSLFFLMEEQKQLRPKRKQLVSKINIIMILYFSFLHTISAANLFLDLNFFFVTLHINTLPGCFL